MFARGLSDRARVDLISCLPGQLRTPRNLLLRDVNPTPSHSDDTNAARWVGAARVVTPAEAADGERHVAGTTKNWVVAFGKEPVMKTVLSKLVKDEQGGEVLEYALIAGLIVVAAIAVITSVGGKVLARWTSLNSSL